MPGCSQPKVSAVIVSRASFRLEHVNSSGTGGLAAPCGPHEVQEVAGEIRYGHWSPRHKPYMIRVYLDILL